MNSHVARKLQHFTHALEQSLPIVAPIVTIVGRNCVLDGVPIVAFDLSNEMVGVKLHLMIRAPEPDQINSKPDGEDRSARKSLAKGKTH